MKTTESKRQYLYRVFLSLLCSLNIQHTLKISKQLSLYYIQLEIEDIKLKHQTNDGDHPVKLFDVRNTMSLTKTTR
jgi:hypothetical protein